MTARVTSSPEENPQDAQALSLWNLHRNLARLADELATAARTADTCSGIANPASSTPSALTPRAYFEVLLRQRREQDRCFGDSLLAEPAWDIMLELMIARIDGRELKVSQLDVGRLASAKIIRRNVEALIEAKLVEHFEDCEREGDCLLALSSEAARRMAELYRARMRG